MHSFILMLILLIIPPMQSGVFINSIKTLQEKPASKDKKYAPSEEIRKLELQMLNLINGERSLKGLGSLSYNDILANIARHHSQEMAEYDKVSHYSPVYGFGLKERIQPTFPQFVTVSENVAMGKDVEKIHQNLLKSPLHYKNIINPQFTIVGIGVVKKAHYLYYITQIFSTSPKIKQMPGKISYYFEKTPASRTKVVTKRWQQRYTYRSSDEQKLVSEGHDFHQKGDYQRAIKKYKEALKKNPHYFYAFYNLGLAYLEDNNLEKALENFNQALTLKPKDAPTRYYIAWIQFTKEEYELSEKNLLYLLKNNKDSNIDSNLPGLAMNTHFLLGRVYDQMGKINDAILHYELFIKQAWKAKYKDIHHIAFAIKRSELLKERVSRRAKKKP